MVTKKTAKPSKRVKSLKAKGLTSRQAKGVKGGFVIEGGRIQDKWGPSGPPILPVNKLTKW